MIANPLKNNEFLTQLDGSQERRIRARITALTWNEEPIETIEGRITGGSISLDGNSNVRRTFNLTMVAEEIDFNQFNWALNTKIKLEVGVINLINPEYDDVIWMPQGIYVLTGFNSSQSVNNYTINLSGKDKMCLLNGDIAGTLNSSIDFGKMETIQEDGTIVYDYLLIKDIIFNIMNNYGQEPAHNIIVNNIDDYGYNLLEYRGDETSNLYLLRPVYKSDSSQREPSNYYSNMTINGDMACYLLDGTSTKLSEITSDDEVSKEEDVQLFTLTDDKSATQYALRRIDNGDVAGYELTDLVYAGDLITKIGESITSVLDKIKDMLGNFEYFYDIDGRFVFQKKANNLYNDWNPIATDETTQKFYVDPTASALTYTFYNTKLFTSISHTPTLNNLKNDFSVWGHRTTPSGGDKPVLLRYAIDRKPIYYKSIDGIEYYAKEYREENYVDWRELIYQMAIDAYKENTQEQLSQLIAENNPDYFPSGRTGYEQYYVDILGFWRTIYNPDPETRGADYGEDGWHKYVTGDTGLLDFWFDFIGDGSAIEKYSSKVIGDRSKVVDDNKVQAIYFHEVPEVIFIDAEEYKKMTGNVQTSRTYIQTNDSLSSFFNISSRGKCAMDVLEELLAQYTYCTESIQITSIPIFYLQPNIRIGITDTKQGIDGEYIISKITLPLTYNGTMQISATKAIDMLY